MVYVFTVICMSKNTAKPLKPMTSQILWLHMRLSKNQLILNYMKKKLVMNMADTVTVACPW